MHNNAEQRRNLVHQLSGSALAEAIEAMEARQLQPKTVAGYVSKLRQMAKVVQECEKEHFLTVDPFVRHGENEIVEAIINVTGKLLKFPTFKIPMDPGNGCILFWLLSCEDRV